MRTLAPWTGMANLKQEMDRLFDRTFEPRWEEVPALGEWAPSLDLTETKDALVARVEVPGMDPEDIQVSLQEQLVTIKGEKRRDKEDKDERRHRVERVYGTFTRAIRLPIAVDAERVTANFKNGVLTITLPKTPVAKGTTIPIKAEEGVRRGTDVAGAGESTAAA
jgi:HSP20 family protein